MGSYEKLFDHVQDGKVSTAVVNTDVLGMSCDSNFSNFNVTIPLI